MCDVKFISACLFANFLYNKIFFTMKFSFFYYELRFSEFAAPMLNSYSLITQMAHHRVPVRMQIVLQAQSLYYTYIFT